MGCPWLMRIETRDEDGTLTGVIDRIQGFYRVKNQYSQGRVYWLTIYYESWAKMWMVELRSLLMRAGAGSVVKFLTHYRC